MTPLREWLKPPRTLLVLLFLLALVSVSAIGWFGWKLLDQERMVDAQRSQERLEHAADGIAATLRGALAETGERLGSFASAPSSDHRHAGPGLLLILSENAVVAANPELLLYDPAPPVLLEAPAEIFSDAEVYEFQRKQPAEALARYEALAASADAAIRAGALLRQGRVLRNTGKTSESHAAYQRLAAITAASVAGIPADLLGRHAAIEISRNAADAGALRQDLLHGRWRLTRGQFAFYWSEAARISGNPDPPPADALAFTRAASLVWEKRRRDPSARGNEILWVEGRPLFVTWRGRPERRAVLISTPESILMNVPPVEDVMVAALDPEGRLLAGSKASGSHAAIRTMADTQLPWTLSVTGSPPSASSLAARQRFLVLIIAVMALFLILGTYFVARVIRSEMQVLRMQSDFVSAVSHEFRSPLTSIRQLSEILAFGRVPAEGRRQIYYETLVREAHRLQRLVEGLLNFGRMEAGARLYRFEVLDTAALVKRVVAEFEAQADGCGHRIALIAAPGRCTIEGDPEAISVALRNLVDNALKYSPGQPTVWVEWGMENGRVAIRVRDQGPGIAASERKIIFRKFVRGSAASTANVKGSGVGLAMVRHIVDAHGGEITVASEPGRGSTFTMLLPAGGKA